MTTKIKKRHTVWVHIDRDQATRIAVFAAQNPLFEISVSIKSDEQHTCKTQFQAWTEDHAEMTKKVILLITNALADISNIPIWLTTTNPTRVEIIGNRICVSDNIKE